MELVRGIPITTYCDEQRLPTCERLRLFMKVCAAVQHAHQKGIIHRDLKPTNILVTVIDGEPVPKVIDFGVAKALGQKLTEKTLFTAFQQMIGTPAYMSPEQAALSGVDVDTRSDIYSLGVLLYELLTGVTPFDADTLRKAALDEIRRMIRETEPLKPSTRLQSLVAADVRRLKSPTSQPSTLNPQPADGASSRRLLQIKETIRLLRGDLDWIVMKCLEKERARRYDTASALAEDLRRHLSHETVQASPPSTAYRARKFIRRHRFGVAMAAMLAITLAAGLIAALTGFAQARRERNRAERFASGEATLRQRAETSVHRLEIQRAQDLFASDHAAQGLGLLAALVRHNSNDLAVAEWLLHELTHRSFALPLVEPLQHDDGVHDARFSPDGQRVLTISRNASVQVFEAQTGQAIAPPLRHETNGITRDSFQAGLHPTWAAFSPDGLRVVTGSIDRTARIWSATDGQALTRPMLHPKWVTAVAFSPDGQLVVTGCEDGIVRLWEATTGQLRNDTLRHGDWVNFIKFSPDGQRLVTGSDDGTIQVWDSHSGQPVGARLRSEKPFRDADFSPDNRRLVTASADRTARLWDTRTGEPIGAVMAHAAGLITATFSPDGCTLATASFDKTARVWDGYTGQPLGQPIPHQGPLRSVRFSPEGERLLTASEDGTARVWDLRTGEPLTEPLVHHGIVWAAEFSPDGLKVVTASSDKTAQVWDVRAGQALGPRSLSLAGFRNLRWSANGTRLLAINDSAKVWPASNIANWPVSGLFQQKKVLSASFSPDGERLVTASEDGTARIWDARSSAALTAPMRHDGPVYDAEFNPDGHLLATTSADQTVKLWNSTTAESVGEALRLGGAALAVNFSPDGQRLLLPCADGQARLVDVRSRQFTVPPLVHSDRLLAAGFSPDGQMVATASADHTARVWNAATGQPLTPPLQHNGPVNGVRFSPHGRWLVTASDDATARVWDVHTGRPVGEPFTHQAQVVSAQFDPASQRVVTASLDGTARLWDLRADGAFPRIHRHRDRVFSAEFSPEGHWLVTGSQDQSAQIWEVMHATTSAPPWLPELAEAVAGRRLRGEQASEATAREERVSPAAWFAVRQRLAQVPGADAYAQWARWFVADRSLRPMSPSARESVADLVRRCLESGVGRSSLGELYLREAVKLNPCYPTAHQLIARNRDVTSDSRTPAGLARMEWASRRALQLAPDDPLSWVERSRYWATVGNVAAALSITNRRASFPTESGVFWFYLAEMFERAHQPEAALGALSRNLELVTAETAGPPRGPALLQAYRSRAELLERMGRAAEAQAEWCAMEGVEARDPSLPATLLDLTRFYNARLDTCWLEADFSRQGLEALPRGRVELGGTLFDIRGVIQLAAAIRIQLPGSPPFPTNATSIPVQQLCRKLHFLHAAHAPDTNGAPIGSYTAHFVDGLPAEVPIVFGRGVLAFQADAHEQSSRPPAVWQTNYPGGLLVRLFKTTWENPRPAARLETLNFTSNLTRAAPFLVAISVER